MKTTNKISYMWIGFFGVLLLTFLDQWTKKMAVIGLAGKKDIVLIPGIFQLHYLENRGAAFGLLQNQRILFVILTILYLSAACWFYWKLPETAKYRWLRWVTVILTAGAIGNFIDRLRLGYVVDFFYFSLIDFPVFNVADIFVVLAFIGIAICIIWIYKDEDFDFLKTQTHKEK